jgi:hypothetical protein
VPLNKDAVTKILRGRIDGADALARELAPRKEYTAERSQRPAAHNHENEFPSRPILSFDLHRTCTPDWGFPLMEAPWPGLKAFMDRMVARGCCVHIVSASLDRSDPRVVSARVAQVRVWVQNAGLPVGWIGPNVEANVRLDDRGIRVDSTATTTPDWIALGRQAEQRLATTWTINPDSGTYVKREDIVPVGTPVEKFPEITDAPVDAPRGWSTPVLDVDIHRTLNPGWGSTREDAPMRGSIEAMQALYAAGYQINLSCAGWMRSTHTQAQSDQRLASFRLYMHKYGIPYDSIVTKDDCDLWFDDKTIQFTSWKAVLQPVVDALEIARREHPAYSADQRLAIGAQRSTASAVDELKLQVKALTDKLNEPKAADKAPDIHIHFPEGMVQAPVTIADGAIRNESHFAAQGGESVFTYDGEGRVSGVRRK